MNGEPAKQATPGIGHNKPDPFGSDFEAYLKEEYRKLEERTSELLEAFERMPDEIKDDTVASKFADTGKMFQAAVKQAEQARKDEKQPYIEAGRMIDTHFGAIVGRLQERLQTIRKRLATYQAKKAEEERRRREEAERKAREEAEAKLKQAKDEQSMKEAVEADEKAKKAAKDAKASDSELARVRGEGGAVASVSRVWKHRIVDRQKIPLETLRHHIPADALDKAIRAYIRAGGRKLEGVEIYQEAVTRL